MEGGGRSVGLVTLIAFLLYEYITSTTAAASTRQANTIPAAPPPPTPLWTSVLYSFSGMRGSYYCKAFRDTKTTASETMRTLLFAIFMKLRWNIDLSCIVYQLLNLPTRNIRQRCYMAKKNRNLVCLRCNKCAEDFDVL